MILQYGALAVTARRRDHAVLDRVHRAVHAAGAALRARRRGRPAAQRRRGAARRAGSALSDIRASRGLRHWRNTPCMWHLSMLFSRMIASSHLQ